jgi:hypothetical protein
VDDRLGAGRVITGSGLPRQWDFQHLWAADLVSRLGTRVGFLAVPLLAVSTLHASALESPCCAPSRRSHTC